MIAINTPCIALTASGNLKAKFSQDQHVHVAFFNQNENRTIAIIKVSALNRSERREALNTVLLYFRRHGIKHLTAEYHPEGCEIIEFWNDYCLTN